MRSLSAELLQDMFNGETGEAILALVTIEHADLSEPIRVSSDSVSTFQAKNITTTFSDDSSNTNNGTLDNKEMWSYDGPGFDESIQFDGINEKATIPDDGSLNVKRGTVEAWFFADANEDYESYNTAYRTLFSKGKDFFPYSTDKLLDDDYDSTVQMVAAIDTTDGFYNVTGGEITLGAWNHAAVTYDGYEIKIFIDGQEAVSKSASGDLSNNLQDAFLGYFGSEKGLNGKMTEVRFWSGARTASQISSNYAGRLSSPTTVDGTTTTADDSVGTSDGTLVNGPTWANKGPNSSVLESIEFDGVDDRVNQTDNFSLSTDFTLEAWIKPDSNAVYDAHDSAYRSVLSKGSEFFPYSPDYLLDDAYADEYQLVANIDTANGSFQAVGGTITIDDWNHIAMTYDGVNFKTFVNGNETASVAATGALVSDTTDLISAYFGSEKAYKGNITDIRLWNVARTITEIDTNKDSRLSGSETGLVGYWKYDDGIGLVGYWPMDDLEFDEYIPFPFEFTLPDQSDEGEMNAKLRIDNVDRKITKAVRTLSSPPTVTTQIVRGSDPDTIEAQFPDFKLSNVSYDQHMVEGTLTLESLVSQPYPGDSFRPDNFVNLF